jgi:ribosomal protein S18 acetylase RimI-like enzyme
MASASVTGIVDTDVAAAAAASVPGLVIRPLRAPDDYAEMNRIANAERARIGMSFTTTVEQIRDYYERPSHFRASRDVAIFELDGRIAGYARGGINQIADGPRVYEIVPFLDPDADAAVMVPLMLSITEHHLRRLAAAEPAADKVLETIASSSVPEKEGAVRAAGYEPSRHAYSMVRPSVDDAPDADLPAGLEIRDVRGEDVRKIWDAGVEAFRDAWGFVEPDEQEYQRFLADPIEFQTDLWRVAWDGDEVVGQVRGYINDAENEQFGRRRGYTESISVRRPWRRRGVARALIAATIRLMRERGMTEVALGVDTENVTGALSLYESCGYVPVSRFTTYRKPID